MASQNPVYCKQCKYLAIARVKGIPYCANCLIDKTEDQSVREMTRNSAPLCFVQHPEMEQPDMDKLKY